MKACSAIGATQDAYEEASRRALTTAPEVNTVAANMKTARETERGTPDRLIKIQRIVPTRKLNQIPNSSNERRSVMSTPFNYSAQDIRASPRFLVSARRDRDHTGGCTAKYEA
jgi:hypothetical protein